MAKAMSETATSANDYGQIAPFCLFFNTADRRTVLAAAVAEVAVLDTALLFAWYLANNNNNNNKNNSNNNNNNNNVFYRAGIHTKKVIMALATIKKSSLVKVVSISDKYSFERGSNDFAKQKKRILETSVFSIKANIHIR